MARPSPSRFCTKCGKESANLRVCPHCFTPYPDGGPGAPQRRSTGSMRAIEEAGSGPSVSAGGARRATGPVTPPAGAVYGRRSTGAIRLTPPEQVEGSHGALAPILDFLRRQTRVVLLSGLGIIAIALFLLLTEAPEDVGDQGRAPVVPSTLTATPAERDEALRLLQRTRDSALVETQADEVMVSYSAAVFPLDAARQRQLVEAFARADEIVEGRKRRIFFYNPSGRVFAQSDGVTGITLTP